MKQMKFLLVALITVLMGVSVTSCMKGDDNTIFIGPAFAKCTDIFIPTFELANGQKLVVSGASLTTLNTGEMYFFYYQYDTAVQATNSPKLDVTLYGGSTPASISAKPSEGPTTLSDMTKANSALYAFNADESTRPAVFFEEYFITPIIYWVKVESSEDAQKKELDKHSFVLTYDPEAIKSGDTELVLTLNHVINDGADKDVVRSKYTSAYKAYNLSNAFYAFQSKAGSKPTKITVKAKVNSSKNSLEGATEPSWSYTFKTN